MADESPKIRIRDLHKSFGENHVLRGLDLDVAVSESVVVIGGSGTGKSVLLKCILGLMEPDQGSIEIDGTEVVAMPRAEREQLMHKFGMLFQGGALFDSLKVWENVAFGLIQAEGMERDQAREIAFAKLAQVGLGEDPVDHAEFLGLGRTETVAGIDHLAAQLAHDPGRDHAQDAVGEARLDHAEGGIVAAIADVAAQRDLHRPGQAIALDHRDRRFVIII